MKEIPDEIFRDELKESRGTYYVTYEPADSRQAFACVQLVFHDKQPTEEQIRTLMEQELRHWLGRYRVPIMVTSFDASDSVLHLAGNERGSHLTGYVEATTGNVVKSWGTPKTDDMPPDQMTAEHFSKVYRGLPSRRRNDVAAAAERRDQELRIGWRTLRTALVLIAAVPLAIEFISLGVTWLGYLLQTVSICAGLYKVANALGWVKKSKSSKDEEEKNRKMRHYYYHCERNPQAFNRLMVENFTREAVGRTRREAEALAARANQNGVKPGHAGQKAVEP